MHPRAEIGFLVGYRASNIWKIWFPHSGKVKHIRDAVIDETRKYTPEYDQYKPIPLPLVRQPQELTTEEITKVINYEITGQQTSTMEESQGIQDRDDPQQHDAQHDNPQQAQENPQQAQDASQEVIEEVTGKASAQRETTPSQGVREEAYWPTPSHPPTRTAPPGAFPEDQDWRRLLNNLAFTSSHHLTIDCDNERTISLLTSEDVAFETKLRHVDIHHHWLRQEVRAGRIMVRWVATASMVADGLTKLLSRQKHENFVRLLRMVDIGYLIA